MYFVKIAATVDDNCVIMIDKLSDQTVMNIIFYFNYNMFIVQEYF